MVYLMPLVLFLLAVMWLLISLFLSEFAYSPLKRTTKAHLLDSLRRVSHAQRDTQVRSHSVLLFFSLVCCLLSFEIWVLYFGSLLPKNSKPLNVPVLVTGHFAPLIYLGMLTLLQVAGEVSQALTERRQNSSAAMALNGYFWLPLLLAWASLAAYLPDGPDHATTGAVSSIWLVVLQPVGCLAFALALIGPYLLINARPTYAVSPIHNWIRELRMVTGLMIITPLIYSRTCFSPDNANFSLDEFARISTFLILPFVLIIVVFRLKFFLQGRDTFDPERLWKVTLWLSMISVTASFIAFHVLGKSDHLMHVLLNFSMLAIWAGFIAPKGNFKQTKILQD